MGSGQTAIPFPLMVEKEDRHLEGNNWFVLGKNFLFLSFREWMRGCNDLLRASSVHSSHNPTVLLRTIMDP
jgi:hypothetical protein